MYFAYFSSSTKHFRPITKSSGIKKFPDDSVTMKKMSSSPLSYAATARFPPLFDRRSVEYFKWAMPTVDLPFRFFRVEHDLTWTFFNPSSESTIKSYVVGAVGMLTTYPRSANHPIAIPSAADRKLVALRGLANGSLISATTGFASSIPLEIPMALTRLKMVTGLSPRDLPITRQPRPLR